MNKIKLILGILCLVAAFGLVLANLALPPENIWFDLGYGNMPWAPPIIFALIGIVLLATSWRGDIKTAAEVKPVKTIDPEKAALNNRIETTFWGLYLIMLAGWWLVPKETAPKGLWSIAVGLLLLSLNAARYWSKLKMSGFTTVLGILSLLGGIVELIGLVDLDGAVLLLVLGAYLILKPWFEKQGFFGKAEED